MTYVITRSCCSDAACVPTCPVNCIHPAPGEPGFGTSEMLYIDPDTCIECSACVQVCPVSAIAHEDDLPAESLPFLELNTTYYRQHPMAEFAEPPKAERREPAPGLRVAIVGSGPAGSYAATELLAVPGVEVNVFERLMTPLGLVRFGVAPDHQTTKAVATSFPYDRRLNRLQVHFGVDVGTDITHEELLEYHHAVIYAVGAADNRRLGIPGEELAGSHSAASFVAWYNGHPEAANLSFDLSHERAVIVGNGNVALDIARVLTAPIDTLAATDIADYALEALRASKIREVVVMGRRGPEDAAYSGSELIELTTRPDLTVTVARADLSGITSHEELGSGPGSLGELKARRVRDLADADAVVLEGDRKQITLRYFLAPEEILGSSRVSGIKVRRTLTDRHASGVGTMRVTGDELTLDAGLVIRSVGFHGRAIPGLPFDPQSGTVPNEEGRVASGSASGAYVTGWIKRGPRGVIGTNRACAVETVRAVLQDFAQQRLEPPSRSQSELDELVGVRSGGYGLDVWADIDAVERKAGQEAGRPRVKVTDPVRLMEIANRAVSVRAAG